MPAKHEAEPEKASVGRIVHTTEGGQCVAAIVTRIANGGDIVDLHVFRPRASAAELRDVGRNGWHWPERE